MSANSNQIFCSKKCKNKYKYTETRRENSIHNDTATMYVSFVFIIKDKFYLGALKIQIMSPLI